MSSNKNRQKFYLHYCAAQSFRDVVLMGLHIRFSIYLFIIVKDLWMESIILLMVSCLGDTAGALHRPLRCISDATTTGDSVRLKYDLKVW